MHTNLNHLRKICQNSFYIVLFCIFSTISQDSIAQTTACNAVLASVGSNTLPSGNSGQYFYRYTGFPADKPYKVKITSSADRNVWVARERTNSSNCMATRLNSGTAGVVEAASIEAGDGIIIRWSGVPTEGFDWNLEILPSEEGNSCLTPAQANLGENKFKVTESMIELDRYTYFYESPINGKLEIENLSNTSIFYYRATSCPNLTSTFPNVITGDNVRTLFNVQKGQQFYFQFYVGNKNIDEEISWNLSAKSMQFGDNCTMAVPTEEKVNAVPANDFWYSYVVKNDGNIKIDVLGEDPDRRDLNIYKNECNRRIFTSYGIDSLTITDVKAGDKLLINWEYGDKIDFAITEEETKRGNSCNDPLQANEGTNLAAEGSNEYYWYSFTMPDEPKGLTLSTSDEGIPEFRVYKGECDQLRYLGEKRDNFSTQKLAPGDNVVIRVTRGAEYGYTGGFDFDINLVPFNSSCDDAIWATIGEHSTVGDSTWYDFTSMASARYKITSAGKTTEDTYIKVLDGCDGTVLAENDNSSGTSQAEVFLNLDWYDEVKILLVNKGGDNTFTWTLSADGEKLYNYSDNFFSGTSVYFGTSIDFGPTTDAGTPMTYEVVSGPGEIVDQTKVVYTGIGEVRVRATAEGNEYFLPYDETAKINVRKGFQEVSVDVPTQKLTTSDPFDIIASSSVGVTNFTYSIVSGPATVTGSTITLNGTKGDVVLEVEAAENELYQSKSTTIRIEIAEQLTHRINFPGIVDQPYDFGNKEHELTATTNSGLPVSYKIISGPATISDNILKHTSGLGEVVIEASQLGNSDYGAALPLQRSFMITKSIQEITIAAISDKEFIDKFDIVASTNSGLDITLAILSGPASLTGTSVSFPEFAEGLVTIEATQAGNDIYAAAKPVRVSFNVSKLHQTIVFESIPDKIATDSPFEVIASGGESGEKIEFSITGPASMSGTSVTLDGTAGQVTIVAMQSGNERYDAAENVTNSFNVSLEPTEPTEPVLAVKNAAGNQVICYPNPAKGSLIVEASFEKPGNVELQLLDISGQLIKSKPMGQSIKFSTTVDTSNLKSGQYLLVVKSANTRTIERVTIIQ